GAAGPLPADTVFVRALKGEFDAVLTPYHDVGMTAVKVAGFGTGVNVTLGLPFPRVAPDHGTALDIAGKGVADPGSMRAALALADRGRARDGRRQAAGADAPLARGPIVFVVDLTDDLLQQVFHGDEARGAAELVQHDREVDLLSLHVREHVLDFPRPRNEDRGAEHGAQAAALGRAEAGEDVLRVHDAEDVVERLSVDGVARPPGDGHLLGRFLECQVGRQGYHLGAWRHDFPGCFLTE